MSNNNRINFSVVDSSNDHRLDNISLFTAPVNLYYPDHTAWLKNTLRKGLDKGFRKVIVATDNNCAIVGCAIIKDTHKEKKICSLYVLPEHRRRGVGAGLINKSMELLADVNINITVCQEINPLLSEHLRNIGFRLEEVTTGMYRQDIKDYHYKSTHIRKTQ